MTVRLSDLRVDLAAVENGAWVEGIPGMGDLALKVRGLDCEPARLRRRLRARRGVSSDDVMTEVLREVVLLDWRGLTDGGEPLPYSAETADILLTLTEFRPFRQAVIWAAEHVGTRRRAA